MSYNPEYWKKYYEKNKEKILEKNRSWSKTEKGRSYSSEYRTTHFKLQKPDRFCKECGTKINKLLKRREVFCSDTCSNRHFNREYYKSIRADKEKYARRLEKLRENRNMRLDKLYKLYYNS